MPKQWTPIIHREYNNSLRYIVSDHDRYAFGVAVWNRLIETDNPTQGAPPVPHRSGRFTIEVMGYIVPFEVAVDAEGNLQPESSEIKLLPVDKAA